MFFQSFTTLLPCSKSHSLMLILCRSGLIFLFSFSFSWSYLNIPVRTAIKPILIITSTEMWGMSIFYPLIFLTSRKECTIRLRVHESHWKGSDRRKESRAGSHELNEKSKQKKSCLNNRTWCPSSHWPITTLHCLDCCSFWNVSWYLKKCRLILKEIFAMLVRPTWNWTNASTLHVHLINILSILIILLSIRVQYFPCLNPYHVVLPKNK